MDNEHKARTAHTHRTEHRKKGSDEGEKPGGALKGVERRHKSGGPRKNSYVTAEIFNPIHCGCFRTRPLSFWVLIQAVIAIILYVPGCAYSTYVCTLDDVRIYKTWIFWGNPDCDFSGRCLNDLMYINIRNPKGYEFTFKTYLLLGVVMACGHIILITTILTKQDQPWVFFIHPAFFTLTVIATVAITACFQFLSIEGLVIEGISPLWFVHALYEAWISICSYGLFTHARENVSVDPFGRVVHPAAPAPDAHINSNGEALPSGLTGMSPLLSAAGPEDKFGSEMIKSGSLFHGDTSLSNDHNPHMSLPPATVRKTPPTDEAISIAITNLTTKKTRKKGHRVRKTTKKSGKKSHRKHAKKTQPPTTEPSTI